ncbi:hypothetical protein BD769DRAFT_1676229 [Suillus cothurnatus]|nr:hypothetical protein BD769DRAFT_1676229 [Suillus cothurnatus]
MAAGHSDKSSTTLAGSAAGESTCTGVTSAPRTVHDPQVTPKRQEHKIRGLDVMMGWYNTKGQNPIQSPPTCLHPQLGDLFIHHYGDTSMQIWLWNNGVWEPTIQDGHHHPVLKDHRLCIRDGVDPSWVTRKMLATYKTRAQGKDGELPDTQFYLFSARSKRKGNVIKLKALSADHEVLTVQQTSSVFAEPTLEDPAIVGFQGYDTCEEGISVNEYGYASDSDLSEEDEEADEAIQDRKYYCQDTVLHRDGVHLDADVHPDQTPAMEE